MTLTRQIPRLLLLAVMAASVACYAAADDETQSTCLQCHAEHGRGDHVHRAVIQGCNNCHVVKSLGNTSRVVLKRADGGLCQQCHAPQKFDRVHLPYALGMCTRCHDPHTSSNPMLLRRSVNELCLECHLTNSDDAPSHDLPTIDLSLDNSMGHPYERHPVRGYTDPIRGGEMSCVSCHLPHGGNMLHYLKMGSEIPEDALNRNSETKDMCHMCHLRLWGLEGIAKRKKGRN